MIVCDVKNIEADIIGFLRNCIGPTHFVENPVVRSFCLFVRPLCSLITSLVYEFSMHYIGLNKYSFGIKM